MTQDQKRLFHLNYSFMWTQLGSSPYRVICSKKPAFSVDNSEILGGDYLPSYAICSQCFRDEYEPSSGTVYKIVKFFNANFEPTIQPTQFLNENLELNSNFRYKGTSKFDWYFAGSYHCYYPSSHRDGGTSGAMLNIYETDNVLKANLITGIHSDNLFCSEAAQKLHRKEIWLQRDMDFFQGAREPGSTRLYFYEGNVEVTASSILIVFRNYEEDDARKLILTLNTKRFPSSRSGQYKGGLAFVLTTSDAPFNTRLYQMGLIRSRYDVYPLQDEQVAKMLKLRTSSREILLNETADSAWYKLIRDKMK